MKLQTLARIGAGTHGPSFGEAALLGWLLLPNFTQWFTSEAGITSLVIGCAVSASFFLLPAAIFKSSRALFLANAPWALLAGLTVAFTMQYGAPVSAGLIQSVMNTGWSEAGEQLRRYAAYAAASLFALCAYVALACRLPGGEMRHRLFMIACGLWSILCFIYLPFIVYEVHSRWGRTIDAKLIQQSYPFNLLRAASAAHQSFSEVNQFRPVLPAGVPPLNEPRKIFVFVIGESTRAHTFDEISAELGFFENHANAIYYPNALAQANFTLASVPMLLTGAQSMEQATNSPSLIDWQNAMGCVTAVVSNNSSVVSLGAAKIIDTVPDGGIMHPTRYDHDMLPVLDGLIASTAPRHLCVTLHMAGSHFDYAARYRKEFERYPVVGDEKARLTAAYRNSVVMVQDFLSRLIARLEKVEAQAFLAFTSDHGENLMEIDGLREHVTHRPTEYEMQVPVVFWANAAYLSATESKWQLLKKNRTLPISNGDLLPTLLHAMGYSNQPLGERGSLMRPYLPNERFFVHPDLNIRSEHTLLRSADSRFRVTSIR